MLACKKLTGQRVPAVAAWAPDGLDAAGIFVSTCAALSALFEAIQEIKEMFGR